MKKINFNLVIFLFSYFLLILVFFFQENITSGGKDWTYNKVLIDGFAKNTGQYFFEYENRHSPVFYMVLALFRKFNLNFEIIRFIHFHIILLILFYFYNCLKIKFKENTSSSLFLLSSIIIILSPNLRTISLWPAPYTLGFLFLIISIYYFLLFEKTKNFREKYLYAYINVFFLALCSYISPNYCLFVIYFLYIYFKKIESNKVKSLIILENIFLSLPAIYYTFFINDLFIFNTSVSEFADESTRFNYSNKVIIICSIIFFHLLPFIYKLKLKEEIINFFKRYFFSFSLIFFVFLLIKNFSFKKEFGGGGIFFQVSDYIFGNNFVFLAIFIISILFISMLIYKKKRNMLLILILILINPQLSIYHKYYDPLFIVIFILLFDKSNLIKEGFLDKKMIAVLFVFYIFFNLSYFVKNYYI